MVPSSVLSFSVSECQRRAKILQFRRLKIWQVGEGTSLSSSRAPDERAGADSGPAADLASCRASQRSVPQAVAIAANRHDVAVMDEPIDPRGGHCSADTQMNPNLARGWAPAVSERSRSLSDIADGLRTEKIRFWREWTRFRGTHGRESRISRDIRT